MKVFSVPSGKRVHLITPDVTKGGKVVAVNVEYTAVATDNVELRDGALKRRFVGAEPPVCGSSEIWLEEGR